MKEDTPNTANIDRKFQFLAVHPGKVGVTYTDADGFIMLAKDNAVPATLRFYIEECKRLGCDSNQIKAACNMLDRIKAWRIANPDKCRVADVEGEVEIAQVLR